MKKNPNWYVEALKEAEDVLASKYEEIRRQNIVKEAGTLYTTFDCTKNGNLEQVVIRVTNQGRYASVRIWSVTLTQSFDTEYSEEYW